jgi:hypothetical protein
MVMTAKIGEMDTKEELKKNSVLSTKIFHIIDQDKHVRVSVFLPCTHHLEY